MSGHDPRDDYDDEPGRGRRAPEDLVGWPAIAMWVLGLGQLVLSVVALGILGYEVMIRVVGRNNAPGEWKALFQREDFLTLLIGALAGAVTNPVILRGATGMRRFRRYWWALAASVLIMCALPFVHLAVVTAPLGAWAIYVLLRRDVRARFAATARGNIQAHPSGPTDAAPL